MIYDMSDHYVNLTNGNMLSIIGMNRASADVGFILPALDLRRLFNIFSPSFWQLLNNPHNNINSSAEIFLRR